MDTNDSIFAALYKYTRALSVALGYRDLLTRLHSERVLGLASAMGAACGLTGHEMGILRIASSFHDIGKIGVPDSILGNPAKLGDTDWETIRRHPEMGQNIVAATEIQGALEASLVIRHHHENVDGTGYPDAIAGEAIPVCSRIISIADCYDAMAVTRTYHPTRSHAEIMAILDDETGRKFDPALMQVFRRVIVASDYKAAAP